MTRYRITVRHGRPQRYHTVDVDAENVAEALRAGADALPAEVTRDADLVELRETVDPDRRSYLGEDDPVSP